MGSTFPTTAIALAVMLTTVGSDKAAAAEPMPAPISLPWTARGNEPGWMLTIDADKMVYKTADGAAIVNVALPKPEAKDGGWIYRAAQADLSVILQPKICRDTMTGMPSPISVSIETGGRTFAGCGGNPLDLLGDTEWQVVLIGDAPVADGIIVSMDFDTTARSVSGSSGCNRYFGGFSISGEGFRFAPEIGGGMMACEELPRKLEAAFLSAMVKVERFDIDAEGSLLLISADRVVIKAMRDKKN